MFEMTIRQRIAGLVLLFLLVLGGLLLFFRGDTTVAGEYPVDTGIDQLLIHVCGAVRNPGVLRCKPGIRKYEAIEQAGGALPNADLDQVNLAEYAEDGEQIYVPVKGEKIKNTRRSGSGSKNAAVQNSKAAATPKPVVQFPLDLNTATAAQLEEVPGIGPALAARIVQYRSEHGPFGAYQELENVPGIGPKKLEKFQPYLKVP